MFVFCHYIILCGRVRSSKTAQSHIFCFLFLFLFFCSQSDHDDLGIHANGLHRRHQGAGVPDQGQHVLADSVLRDHHRRVLRGTALRAGRPVHGDRGAPDGRPGHQLHGQRVQSARPPTGGAHAGHRRPVVLRVPAPVPRFHHVDHTGAGTHVPGPGRQALLHHTVLVPGHGLPELGRQSDPVQPDVVKVPAGLLQALPVPVRRRR